MSLTTTTPASVDGDAVADKATVETKVGIHKDSGESSIVTTDQDDRNGATRCVSRRDVSISDTVNSSSRSGMAKADNADQSIGESATSFFSPTEKNETSQSTILPPYMAVDGYEGELLNLHANQLRGWISSQPTKDVPLPLAVSVEGSESVCYIEKFAETKDTKSESSGDEKKYFCIDVSSITPNGKLHSENGYVFSITIPEDGSGTTSADSLILRQLIEPSQGVVLNPNGELYPSSLANIDGWEISSDERIGLRLDRFSMPCQSAKQTDSFSPKAFTRISLQEHRSTGASVTLSCPVDMYSVKTPDEVEIALYIRADRPATVQCRLMRATECVSSCEVTVDSEWELTRSVLFGSRDKPIFLNVHYSLDIIISHSGRGFVDIATCALNTCESLDKYLDHLNTISALSDEKPGDTSNQFECREYVRNSGFVKWSSGVFFDSIQPRQEVADGWKFECRAKFSKEVVVQLEKIPSANNRSICPKHSEYGMRVLTGSFEGPMRIVGLLDPSLLDCCSLELSVDAYSSSGGERRSELRRIYILGRGAGKESILLTLMNRTRFRDRAVHTWTVTEFEMIQLRMKSTGYKSLILAVEFEQKSDLTISSVSLKSRIFEATRSASTSEAERGLKNLCFEDYAVSSQLSSLKGVEHWTQSRIVEKIDMRVSQPDVTAEFAPIYEFKQPRIRRPSLGYPSVDIVVPIYNAFESVRNCVRSILEETAIPYTLICVDDGSSEETRLWLDEVSKNWSHVDVLRNPTNLGYTKTVNRGIEASLADWTCILNSDCIVTTNWLEKLIDVTLTDNPVGIVGPLSNAASYQSVPRIRNAKKEWSFNPLPASVSPNDMADLIWENSSSAHPRSEIANGFCQLINRKMLDQIGWLDETAFPRGFGEENDLCARVVKAGWEIRIADDTYVYHSKSKSFGHSERKRLSVEGTVTLKKKHPDVDWDSVVRNLEQEPALVQLRKKISAL